MVVMGVCYDDGSVTLQVLKLTKLVSLVIQGSYAQCMATVHLNQIGKLASYKNMNLHFGKELWQPHLKSITSPGLMGGILSQYKWRLPNNKKVLTLELFRNSAWVLKITCLDHRTLTLIYPLLSLCSNGLCRCYTMLKPLHSSGSRGRETRL